MQQWAFEQDSAAPKLLRARQGHVRPPSLIRFYGEDGKSILSAGGSGAGDLRMTSVVRDSRSFELSQGALLKRAKELNVPIASLRLPPITALDFSVQRRFDWDDVLTAHAGSAVAHSWSVENKRLGAHAMRLDKAKAAVARAVCVSACGNFGFVAFGGGMPVVGWNMQSGLQRRSYDLAAAADSRATAALTPTGLVADALNRHVVVGTQIGQLHFFDFKSCALVQSVRMPAGILALVLQRDSGLLAVVGDDMVVRVVDMETRRVVRELSAFRGRILDVVRVRLPDLTDRPRPSRPTRAGS